MRKLSLVIAVGLALYLPYNSQAQIPLRGYGLEAGLVSSGIYTSPEDVYPGQDRRYGFAASVYAEWFGESFSSVLTEAGYVQRGYYESLLDIPSLPGEVVQSEAGSRLDYVSLSALAKFRHFGEENATGYAFIGPRIEVLANRKTGMLRTSEGTFQSPIADNYDRWTFGGTVGLGLEVENILPTTITLEACYDLDLSNSLSNERVVVYRLDFLEYEAKRVSAINHAFRVSLGILL